MSNTEQPVEGAHSAPACFPSAADDSGVYDERDRLVMLTPCYGGQQSSLFRDSLHDAQTKQPRANFRCADGKVRNMAILAMAINLPGDSHIDRARNNIIHDALQTHYRNFLFCDADQPFEAHDIAITWVRLMSGVRVIGGSVALKTLRTIFACNTVGNTKTPGPDGLLPGRDTGTGWMGFRRDVLDEIRERWPAYVRERVRAAMGDDISLPPHPKVDGVLRALAECGLSADISYLSNQDTPHAGQTVHAYFASGVAFRDGAGDWLSEDWMFCHRCLLLGIPIKIDPQIRIKHLGWMLYPPDPKQLIEATMQVVSGKNPPFNKGLCYAAEQVLTALNKDIRDESISILHATRRPEQALKVREQWLSRARNPKDIEYLFGVDLDDAASQELFHKGGNGCAVPPSGGIVAPINAVAKLSTGRILIMAADDCEPPQDWDLHVREALKGQLHEPRLLWTSDGHSQQPVITHPIMTRALYQAQGYFFCPEYPHLFCDTELTFRASQAGQIIDARHIVLKHDHPMFTGQKPDALHLERNSAEAWRIGSEIFKRRNPTAQ